MKIAPMNAAVLAIGLAGCGAEHPTVDVSETGTIFFRFTMTDGVRHNESLKRPLIGTVYGTIYNSADVAFWGPLVAEGVSDVRVENVNLETETTSLEYATSPELPAGKYVFLGMLDLDGTGDEPNGEPVTAPSTNKFVIEPKTEGKRPILFDLVH